MYKHLLFVLLALTCTYNLRAQKNIISVGAIFLREIKSPFGSAKEDGEYGKGVQPCISYGREITPRIRASLSTGTTFFQKMKTSYGNDIMEVKNTSLAKVRLGAGYTVINQKVIFNIGANIESHLMQRKTHMQASGENERSGRLLLGYGGGCYIQLSLKHLITPPVFYVYENIGGNHFNTIGIEFRVRSF